MKLAGFLLLLAGWGIVLTALMVLPQAAAQACFMLAGIAVEVMGLTIAFRSHMARRGQRG